MYRITPGREECNREPRPVSPKENFIIACNAILLCNEPWIKIFPRSLLLRFASLVLSVSFCKVDALQNDTENTQRSDFWYDIRGVPGARSRHRYTIAGITHVTLYRNFFITRYPVECPRVVQVAWLLKGISANQCKGLVNLRYIVLRSRLRVHFERSLNSLRYNCRDNREGTLRVRSTVSCEQVVNSTRVNR